MAIMKIMKYWLEAIVCFLLVILVLSVFSQVFIRFVVRVPFPWIDEIVRMSFVYMTFLGAALGVKYSQHLTVEVIENLPRKIRNTLISVGYVLTLIFIVVYIFSGWEYSIGAKNQYSPVLEIPNMYLHFILPISGVIMLYYLVKNIIREIQGWKEGEKTP